MTITFSIHYHTEWGQHLAVVGNLPELGNGDPMQAVPLNYQEAGLWSLDLEAEQWPDTLSYHYILVDERAGARHGEGGAPRKVGFKEVTEVDHLLLKDSWRDQRHAENALRTSAFADVILRPDHYRPTAPDNPEGHPVVRFQIDAPQVPPGYQLAVCGNVQELGNWDLSKPLLLGNPDPPRWKGSMVLRSGLSLEYKYGLADPVSGRMLLLESGDNRTLATQWLGRDGQTKVVLSDTYFRHPAGPWRGTGVAMPVFALRTQSGLGVGEFLDLPRLVDWAENVGMNMVQILPVNDTSATMTWTDSYPYAAISVFALHPLYLHLEDLGTALDEAAQAELEAKRKELNALTEVDYEKVMAFKLAFTREVYQNLGKAWLAGKDFQAFLRASQHWLKPYAAFCHLRDQYGTVDYNAWGEHAVYSEALVEGLVDPESDTYESIGFYYFLQYHLDRQLGKAAAYARERGIILKGDIPIGIYRYSVDAWVAPELYNMSGQSGAPPDPFSDTGQNWGFPTYNWGEMARDGYTWWQQRLRQLSRYFDAFRIDHILGFFRIWEIPLEQVEGLMGHFNPALPVRLREFADRGIPFDEGRFCSPFITDATLDKLFGQDSDLVRRHFLQPAQPGQYTLKPECATQRKIEAFLGREEHAGLRHLRDGLFSLAAEVLFFEAEGSQGEAFHPRILMPKTHSFQALPPEVQGKLEDLYLDYFYRRQESFWRQQAMTKLPAIKEATNMLICGEDLGMVPDCVPGVMDELGILSLEIQRMSKNPETEFLAVADIPYLSVCSPSTHDMSPLRAWWEEISPAERERFFFRELGLAGAPPLFCEPVLAERIIDQHLQWPCMWAVFPIQDLLAIDGVLRRDNPFEERINVPANPRHYWRYRLHLTLEQLIGEAPFNQRVRRLIADSGRGVTPPSNP